MLQTAQVSNGDIDVLLPKGKFPDVTEENHLDLAIWPEKRVNYYHKWYVSDVDQRSMCDCIQERLAVTGRFL